ncbi:MAG: ABC transporter ATP-binding protein/permease [Clostridiales bacterium]|nr:ABC transporter ATP-binding protein/permease [Clostridiales bacterium]
MLKLTNIVKVYQSGDTKVEALRGVSLEFRQNEFVSILGPSGCGKTTLLNIIGGLDRYTSGDLSVNGRSTKNFTDRDYDEYRNRSVGFVFQNYNLISHQTVLANVELALTLSGVSKSERRRRAIDALTQVGLADQLKKKPNQLSGGQMQRVAIARALVNDPEILLADEPTGALDSETSVSVLEILKEISKDRLIIMVTHNSELAEKYSTRIIKLLDGNVTDDSNPYSSDLLVEKSTPKKQMKTKRARKAKRKNAMSFFTALSLSFNNLLTKKARTLLTSFAGSIGIIGIALILSISNGFQTYIDSVQEATLSSYPIIIEAETMDMGAMMTSIMGARQKDISHDLDAVYSSSVTYELSNALNTDATTKNNLHAFNKFLETDTELDELLSAIQYTYDIDYNIYTKDEDNNIIKSDISALMDSLMSTGPSGSSEDMSGQSGTQGSNSGSISSMFNMSRYTDYSTIKIWEEILPGEGDALVNDLLYEQYDLVYGKWPESYDELVLIVDRNNEISDLILYGLGLKSIDEMREVMIASAKGEKIDIKQEKWSYSEICDKTFSFIPSWEFYQYDSTSKTYKDVSGSSTGLSLLYENGIDLKITGIIRQNPDASASMMTGAIGYTSALTDYIIDLSESSELIKAQLENPETDVLTGLPFLSDEEEVSDSEKATLVTEYFSSLENARKAAIYTEIMSVPSPEYIEQVTEQQMASMTREYVETVMAQMYAEEMGVDLETVTGYISEMDDETLFTSVREMMAQRVQEEYAAEVQQRLGSQTTDELSYAFDATISELPESELAKLFDKYMPSSVSESTYEDNLKALGYVDRQSPKRISLFTATFEAKDRIADIITEYNNSVEEEDKIVYTDYVALLMSSVTTIINAISYVLIAFVAISLVVSSIMIGIITYISVLERTKEIGILRSIGASKKDISRVFNAETLVVGFASGFLGIGITLLLIIPINAIIQTLTGISSLSAILPLTAGGVLIIISMLLTFIAGLIPSRIAAKKDPVEALRTE